MSISTLEMETMLHGFRRILRDMTGKDAPITPDTRIDRHLKQLNAWDDIDPLDFMLRTELYFDCKFTREDWESLSHYRECKSPDEWERRFAHDFTFGRMAELLAGRTLLLQVKPEVFIGRPCLAAGAFSSMERLVLRQNSLAPRFGPSTPIHQVLKGSSLRRFWRQVQLLTRDLVPPLPNSRFEGYLKYGVVALAIDGVAILLTQMIVGDNFSASLLFNLTVALCALLALLMVLGTLGVAGGAAFLSKLGVFVVKKDKPQLPVGIATFGDLSRLVARVHRGFCPDCGRNLLGVVSPDCPECNSRLPAYSFATAGPTAST